MGSLLCCGAWPGGRAGRGRAETDSGQHHGGSPGKDTHAGAEAVRFVKGTPQARTSGMRRARLTI
ncbi:hypothetical protein SNK04_014110 [Fusarium graminearum]